MKLWKTATCLSLAVVLCATAPGCKKKTENEKTGKTGINSGHPTKGPHDGKLVELGGNHEYHGEYLFDKKTETVTIYILDGDAKKQVAVDAKEVVLKIKHGGGTESYKLAANPDKENKDPEGKSSRFQSKDGELAHALEHGLEEAQPEMTIVIGGNQYIGKIK